MALTAQQAQRVLDIQTRASAATQALEDAAAIELARTIEFELSEIERLVAEGVIRNVDQALAAFELAVDAISARGADLMTALQSDMLDLSLGATADSVRQFGVVSARSLAVASRSVAADFYDYLISEGHANWYAQLSDALREPVRQAVLDMTVRPLTAGEAAQRLADATDMSISRARGIVRTESTRADTAISVSFADAAGMNRFINIGVGDTRQSGICRFASMQDAMTIEKWNALRFEGERVGPPPRHVRRCRCKFMPVPEPFQPSDALLEEAGVIA